MNQTATAQTTAGFLNTDWNPRNVPAGTKTTNVVLRTADNAATGGSLYEPATPSDTVVCVMHPREFMACHYLIPDIVGAGYAAWSPVYSTTSTGCVSAAAVFARLAFDERPDHVESQLSGVHWRAKPTAP